MLKKYGKYILGILLIIASVSAVGVIVYKVLTYEKGAEDVIDEMARKYYEEVYYVNFSSKYESVFDTKIKELEQEGLVESLFDIARNIDHPDKYRLYNSNDGGINCDLKKTYITYKPKSPYGPTDYVMEKHLECE
jgi:hypothetical protein